MRTRGQCPAPPPPFPRAARGAHSGGRNRLDARGKDSLFARHGSAVIGPIHKCQRQQPYGARCLTDSGQRGSGGTGQQKPPTSVRRVACAPRKRSGSTGQQKPPTSVRRVGCAPRKRPGSTGQQKPAAPTLAEPPQACCVTHSGKSGPEALGDSVEVRLAAWSGPLGDLVQGQLATRPSVVGASVEVYWATEAPPPIPPSPVGRDLSGA